MKFSETDIAGVLIVELEEHGDERGFFARTWCKEEFAARGLNAGLEQCSISYNLLRGTLRGMHYQAAPHTEAKLVRVTRGAVYDVAIDLRRDSSSYGKWFGLELSDENRRALYIPESCAHGFLTLADGSEVLYQISTEYVPAAGRGLRWNDPAFAIRWPLDVSVISERDRRYPDYQL